MGICYYCETENETRPYGRNGTAICFDCAMATPERKKQIEEAFLAQLNASGHIVILGEETGPRPFINNLPN